MRCLLFFLAFVLIGFAATSSAPAQTQAPAEVPIEIVPNVGHSFRISTAAFSTDGRMLASGGEDKKIKIWDTASWRLLRTLEGLSGDVNSVLFSPDGRILASLDGSTTIRSWNVASGKPLRTFTREGGNLGSIAFSPDGRRLAGAGSGGVIYVWDVATASLLRSISASPLIVFAVAFSPNGRTLASAGDDSKIKLWDAGSSRLIRTLAGHSELRRLAFSPDGRILASGGDDKTTKLWDVASGKLLQSVETPISPEARTNKDSFDGKVKHLVFSPDGLMLAVSSEHLVISVLSIPSGALLSSTRGTALAFSPDGRTLVGSRGNYTVDMWEPQSARLLRALGGDSDSISSVTLSPDGRTLAAGGWSVNLWDATTGQLRHRLEGLSMHANSVAISSDGRTVAAGETGQKIRLWSAETGKLLHTLPVTDHSIESVVFVPGGRTLASGSGPVIQLWDSERGSLLRRFETPSRGGTDGTKGSIYALAYSPDAQILAAGYFGTSIELWEMATPKSGFWGSILGKYGSSSEIGRLIRTLDGPCNGSPIAFSPDGKIIASGACQVIRLSNVQTGQILHTIATHKITSVDVMTGEVSHDSVAHDSFVNAVAFSPDGRLLASASSDHTVKLWDVTAGRLIRTLIGHSFWVKSVVFTSDGRSLISGSSDGTMKVWRAENGELLATLIASREGQWLTITPEGFFDASDKGAEMLSVVRGLEIFSIAQFYQALYRPDLVREKLAGDTRGLVRQAAAKLDLTKVLASGNAPIVNLLTPRDGTRATGEQLTAEIELRGRGGGIGRVEWRVNGVTVGIETPSAQSVGQPLRLTRGLVLDDGENEIEVVAYNAANLLASVPARATVAGQAPASRTPARMFVLAVGLNDYAEAKFRLTYAVPDAKALVAALTEGGKGVYESVEVTLVQDADVKRGKLDAVFADLATKVRPSDVFVFFLGGHGKTVDGRYYFIPQDFHIEGTVTKPVLESAVVKQGIAQEQWQQWLARIPAKKSVLLFDTCESGSLTGEGKETRALERGAANDRLVQATGRTILTASSDDTDAFEGFRGHGLFTYNVLEALERADSDGNGRIEVAELAAYVYAQVTALSEQVFKQRQVPQVRITGNYSLAKPTQIFAGKEPGIVLPGKATHQMTAASELLVLPAMGARRVRKLDAKTPVTLVKSDAGWTLIAREGRPLGFVATKDLVPIQ